jgi:uncharacterized protein
MTGETDLNVLIRSMRAELREETFVFISLPAGQAMPLGLSPQMVFQEREGTTLIVGKSEAADARLGATFECRMITVTIHSSLEAVGFMAAITTKLAAAGIGVNPVSAYFHDHLFVPAARADEALRLLHELAAERSS